VLRPVIPEDPRRRRRRHRAYTTGGLSPLQETPGRPSTSERLTGGRRARRSGRALAR